jgi:outer membrane protein assembly factor BamB
MPAPETQDANLVITAVAGFVRGLDRTTGRRVWEVQVVKDARPLASCIHLAIELVIREDMILAAAYSDNHTGAVRWYADLGRIGRKTILLDGDQIFVGLIRSLFCYNVRGELLWADSAETGGSGVVSLGVPGNVRQADQGD